VALSKPRALTCELTCLQSSWWSAQNSHEEKKINNENTTAGTGSGFEQAQGPHLWIYMLIIKLMVSSKLSWENRILQGKYHCRYRQWLWASPWPSAVSLHAHNQADGQLKTHVRKNKLTMKIPLSVPAVALSKPRAISCELTCSQSCWWSTQNSRVKKKIAWKKALPVPAMAVNKHLRN
jgi:hypothetical protein